MSMTSNRFSPEVRGRPVRMVGKHRAEYASPWVALMSIAGKMGYKTETLRRWCREEAIPETLSAQRASGADIRRQGPAEAAGARGRGIATRQRDPWRGVGILRASGARPPGEVVMGFIKAHHRNLVIEPICRELAIAPSSRHGHAARLSDASKQSAWAQRDDMVRAGIETAHAASFTWQ